LLYFCYRHYTIPLTIFVGFAMEQNTIYAFGQFRLDTATQLLWEVETNITLTPKVYRLLLYFLLHTGRLISHEELLDTVWDGRNVDDSALRLAVNSLRNALQDESKAPRYILTVCKRGYRFLAGVTECHRIAEADRNIPLHYRPQVLLSPASHGHSSELAALQEAFQQAVNGVRRLVFLYGEQGIGKTALLETFIAKIQHPELAVLCARCVQMGGAAEPFLPLLEALESHCREPYGRLLIERLGHLAPSWLYQMLNVLDTNEIARLESKVAHINTGRMLREGADFFEMLSNNASCILILDNAHWSDEFTLDLLNFLMFRNSPAKLLIIVSYRPYGNSPAAQRIEGMRTELVCRGLCQDLPMQSS
ncbi:MAG: winged helix-turn-helix domain-containing protein, partial [Methylovulum sp.]|nr:winged helix-turn-helix domain-containing protein [Methylovulum sp.]